MRTFSKLSLIALTLALLPWTSAEGPSRSAPVTAERPIVASRPLHLPIAFEPNLGQAADGVRFLTRGSRSSLSLTDDGLTLHLGGAVVRTRFLGAREEPPIVGEGPTPTLVNSFVGDDPSRWVTRIPTFSQVRYRELFPGVDLVVYGLRGALEYDLQVAPGADPTGARFALDGWRARLGVGGDLVLSQGGRIVRLRAPSTWQEVDGRRVGVLSRYALGPASTFGFRVGPYDHTLPLVIDPPLTPVYATYMGGTSADEGTSVALGSDGTAYLVGTALGPNLATTPGCPIPDPPPDPIPPHAYQCVYQGGGHDAFVASINPDGTAANFVTYLGGTDKDRGRDIVVDDVSDGIDPESAALYISGFGFSKDFPMPIAGTFQTTSRGSQEIWVAKLSLDGTTLYRTSFLGGTGKEGKPQIALAASTGDVIVSGYTFSTDFHLTANAYRKERGGGADAFVARFRPNLTAAFSTYMGGNDTDVVRGVKADATGIYLTGFTFSTNFPHTHGFQTTKLGPATARDAFVTKMASDGRTFVWSTYMGGTGDDAAYNGNGMAIDAQGNAWVTGYTKSVDFPVTASPKAPAHQSAKGGKTDSYVAKLGGFPDLFGKVVLLYSTYLGGLEDEDGTAIAVDGAGDVYATGGTFSNPLTPGTEGPRPGGQDAYLAAFGSDTSLGVDPFQYAQYIGGSGTDKALGVAVIGSDPLTDLRVMVVGYTTSDPATFSIVSSSPIQSTKKGSQDAFVTKLQPIPTIPPP